MGQTVHFVLGVDWIVLTTFVGAMYLGLYYLGKRRSGSRLPRRPLRVVAFCSGLAVLLVAFDSPLYAYDNFSFFAHTAQHLLLMFGVAPLVALGAPITLVLRAAPTRVRDGVLLPVLRSRLISFLTHPLVAFGIFAGVQSAIQFTPFFNAALNNGWPHVLEHALYLGSGFLFWWPILSVDAIQRRASLRTRLAALLLAIPIEAALGLALLFAGAPLYAHYASLPSPWGGHGALASQHRAGLLLWLGGDAFVAAAACLLVATSSRLRAEGRFGAVAIDVGPSSEDTRLLGGTPRLGEELHSVEARGAALAVVAAPHEGGQSGSIHAAVSPESNHHRIPAVGMDNPLGRRLAQRVVLARRLADRAQFCRLRGSPLYGALLQRAAEDMRASGPSWTILQGHEVEPRSSALALRFMAAVHHLVLDGRAPELAPFYPSVGGSEPPREAGQSFIEVLAGQCNSLRELVRHPMQTNDVGRCRPLLGGFLTFAEETRMPFRILELGASGGLNLRWDTYRYEGSNCSWGDPSSPVTLPWGIEGACPPTDVPISVVGRRGCDLTPIDPCGEVGRLRLLSLVWADQIERFNRLRDALDAAPAVPVMVDTADACIWLPHQLKASRSGTGTVVFQSILRQFLSRRCRVSLQAILKTAGKAATADSPLAWLRMEAGSRAQTHKVRITTWPGGKTRLVAITDLYGERVTWLHR
jgi:cytochrome c oxidase assembly factor CtaG